MLCFLESEVPRARTCIDLYPPVRPLILTPQVVDACLCYREQFKRGHSFGGNIIRELWKHREAAHVYIEESGDSS